MLHEIVGITMSIQSRMREYVFVFPTKIVWQQINSFFGTCQFVPCQKLYS